MAQTFTGRIHNLTVMADAVRFDDAGRIRVLDTPGLSAELLSGTSLTEQPAVQSEALYVVVAGEAILEGGAGGSVIVTAGDVVLVPAEVEHRFVQQSRKFRTWRIELAARTER